MNKGNQKIERELKNHLDSGEKLLWGGKPKQEIILKRSDILLIPFSLMWGGFAIFWEYSVISSNAPFFFKLWGIPFVLVGVYFIIGRFFYDAKRRKETLYGITSTRLIIKSGVFSKKITSLNIDNLPGLTLIEKGDRSGTVVLGNETAYGEFFRGSGVPEGKYRVAPAFELIKNARKVYTQITDIQKAN